jgi:rare lipoprotein A
MFAMTACHPTLPFGTLVRVVDVKSKKSVVVRINDRGQLDKGRVIDLSYAAATELNMTRAGLAQVSLEVISLGKSRRGH